MLDTFEDFALHETEELVEQLDPEDPLLITLWILSLTTDEEDEQDVTIAQVNNPLEDDEEERALTHEAIPQILAATTASAYALVLPLSRIECTSISIEPVSQNQHDPLFMSDVLLVQVTSFVGSRSTIVPVLQSDEDGSRTIGESHRTETLTDHWFLPLIEQIRSNVSRFN